MGDNQRTLNATNAHDARLRDLHMRVEEATFKKKLPDLADPSPVEEEPMDIRVDSPTTIHHNYGEQPSSLPAASAPAEASDPAIGGHQRPRPSWLLPAALAVGAAMTGAAGPAAYLAWQAMQAAPVLQQADENTLYEFHLSKGE
jgi:hypothetical protein